MEGEADGAKAVGQKQGPKQGPPKQGPPKQGPPKQGPPNQGGPKALPEGDGPLSFSVDKSTKIEFENTESAPLKPSDLEKGQFVTVYFSAAEEGPRKAVRIVILD